MKSITRFNAATAALHVGLDTLRAHPLRTLLSTLGIILGVGSLVSVLSLGDGMQRYAIEQVRRTTDLQAVVLAPRMTVTVDGRGFPRPDTIRFATQEAADIAAQMKPGTHVRLMVSGDALLMASGASTQRAAEVMGVAPAPDVPVPMLAGRGLTDVEATRGSGVAMVSASLAARLGHPRSQDALGDTLRFGAATRLVIGVMDDGGTEAPRVVMPFEAAVEVLPLRARASATITITASSIGDVPRVRADVEAWATRRYGRAWKERLTIATNETRVKQVTQGMLVFKLFMGALTGVSLLVGGVGIMNILLASIVERTREIGIRKASGASRRHILLQFLFESVSISTIGSLAGLVLGFAVAFSVTALMRRLTAAPIYAAFSAGTSLTAVLAAAIVGISFGLYPALRASRMSPIEAIRHE